MAVAFQPGQETLRGDLDIFLTNNNGPTNAAEISYALYYLDPGPPEHEVLIGPPERTPVNPAVGEYYAALLIPLSANVGTYRIKWTMRELVTSPQTQTVMEFAVVAPGTVTALSPYTTVEQEMIATLRTLLRDNNPDRNYHFRPPEHEATVGAYNRVFGYVWEDAELLVYLKQAVHWWDMFPPSTHIGTIDKLVVEKPEWQMALQYGGMMFALMALAINWVHEEFDYSIGGVSLSLEKSSKYESLKSNAEQQFDKATEAKARTVKFIRSVQQPRYGIGIRSAFGPNVGRGILSPRNFL